jgi:dTDP-4-dehydrorhamnose reductase
VSVKKQALESLLIIGADGQVGLVAFQDLADRGYEVTGTTRRSGGKDKGHLFLDFSCPSQEWPELPDVSAAIICTAITGIRDCEKDPEGTSIVNFKAPVMLAEMLCRQGAFVLFLSSTGVFDFTRSYRRHDDPPCPVTNYGRQKAEAEEKILALNGKTAVLRLTKIVGPDMPLLNKWQAELASGQNITAYEDTTIAPITALFASRVMHEIIIAGGEGIFHASGDDDLPYTVLAEQLIWAIRAGPERIEARTGNMKEYPSGSSPRYTSLDMSRERDLFGLTAPSSLETMKEAAETVARHGRDTGLRAG